MPLIPNSRSIIHQLTQHFIPPMFWVKQDHLEGRRYTFSYTSTLNEQKVSWTLRGQSRFVNALLATNFGVIETSIEEAGLRVQGGWILERLLFPTGPLLLLEYKIDGYTLVSKSQLVGAVLVAFLLIIKAHMNIFIIVKVTILVLIKWSYRSPPLC